MRLQIIFFIIIVQISTESNYNTSKLMYGSDIPVAEYGSDDSLDMAVASTYMGVMFGAITNNDAYDILGFPTNTFGDESITMLINALGENKGSLTYHADGEYRGIDFGCVYDGSLGPWMNGFGGFSDYNAGFSFDNGSAFDGRAGQPANPGKQSGNYSPESASGLDPDYANLGVSLGAEGAKEGFIKVGKNLVEAGRASGTYSMKGAVTATKLARGANLIGNVGNFVLGAYSEAKMSMDEGQSTTATVIRATASGTAEVALGVASFPISILDAATGSNFTNSMKQVVRVPVALAGTEQQTRNAAESMKSGQCGFVVKEAYLAGEYYEKELGLSDKIYSAGKWLGIFD
ncbi:hypothetical protein HY745_14170 [Candidatus Desantisbacteria bacterium]|nr:hypothetical protein [Candidatus Desantisbacteria bacterium]